MAKINWIDICEKNVKEGDKSFSKRLMRASLSAIRNAEFGNEDAQEFLIQAFEDIITGVPAEKALYLNSGIRGKSKTADIMKQYDIGREIADCHRKKIEGKTKGRPRNTPLNECFAIAEEKHDITFSAAERYYKVFLAVEKSTAP